MVLSTVEAVAAGVVLTLVYFVLKYPNRGIFTNARPDLKSPRPGWPLIGNLPWIIATRERIFEHQLVGFQETGPTVTMTLPFMRIISINKPEWIEYVQKTNFANFVNGHIRKDNFYDLLGGGIFTADGHHWAAQRKTSSHIFTANAFRTVIGGSIQSHLVALSNVLGKYADGGREVALNEVFFRFTLDTFVKMSFGEELHSVAADKPVPFAEAFDFAQNRLERRFNEPFWPYWEPLTADGRKMKIALKTIDDFCYSIIDARDARGSDEKAKQGEAFDLLALYRGIKDESGNKLSRKELRDAVLNLILAGRDTTAQALAWTFFYVLSDPSLLDTVRSEIADQLGDAQVTYDNYAALVRTKALFYEALRLHPSVPKNGKVAIADDHIPHGGPMVRAGEIVVWSDWTMARDTKIWGPDAKEFNPKRWIEDDGQTFKRFSQWQWHAFNGGPRLCLGQNLATFEAIATIVELARHFDFRFAPGYLETTPMTSGIADTGKPTPMYQNSLTLPMKHPLRCILTRRA